MTRLTQNQIEEKYNVSIIKRDKELVSSGKKYMLLFSDKTYTDYDFENLTEITEYLKNKDNPVNEDNQVNEDNENNEDNQFSFNNLSFTYGGKYDLDTKTFLSKLLAVKYGEYGDKDEVIITCKKYIEEKQDKFSNSTIKKYLANIRNILKNDCDYLAKYFDESLLDDNLIHIAYSYLKLDESEYKEIQDRDKENKNEKIDDKTKLSDEVIEGYLVKSREYLLQRDDYKLAVIAVCALTGRRFIEVFKTIQDYDIDSKYILKLTSNELAKQKNDRKELIDCYCLVESNLISDTLDWLKKEVLPEILKEKANKKGKEVLTNNEINGIFKTTINDCVKKYYSFLPTPSTSETLSIHDLRAVSTCLMVQLFTNENNDVDLFLAKTLGHSGDSAKDFYKSYYIPSESSFKRGLWIDRLNDELDYENEENEVNEGEKIMLTVTKEQLEVIEKFGGIDKVIEFVTTINPIGTKNKNESDDEFNGYQQYHRIKNCIDKIKEYNENQEKDEDKIALTSTAIYQLTGIRTDTISNFRSETKYGDFDSYNNQFSFNYRQNSGKNLKELISV